MATPRDVFFGVNGVRASASFPATNPQVMGNTFLESVLAVRGSDMSNPYDYDYVATYGLTSNGSVYYGFEEWIAVNELGNQTYRPIWSWTTGFVTPDYALSTPVTIQMTWVGNSIDVTFAVKGVIKHEVQDCFTCRMPTALTHFIVGLILNSICCQDPWNDSYGLLFGVNGESGVFAVGWNVRLENLSFRNSTSSPWQLVSSAKTIGGVYAWISHAVTYGGYNYDGVTADYSQTGQDPCLENNVVTFHYTGNEIPDQTTLWSGNPTAADSFTLSTSIAAISVPAGSYAIYHFNVESNNAYCGQVSVSASITPSPNYSPSFGAPIPNPINVYAASVQSYFIMYTATATPQETYTIALQGVGLRSDGASLQSSLNFHLTVSYSCSVTANPTSGNTYVTVHFSVGSCNGGTPPYSYSWQWGDGTPCDSTCFRQNTTHTYYYGQQYAGNENFYPKVAVTDSSQVMSLLSAPTITVRCPQPCSMKPSLTSTQPAILFPVLKLATATVLIFAGIILSSLLIRTLYRRDSSYA